MLLIACIKISMNAAGQIENTVLCGSIACDMAPANDP